MITSGNQGLFTPSIATVRVTLTLCSAGIIVVTMVLIVCLSFSGYLVNNIPVYFKWMGKLSYFSYAYAALVGYVTQGLC